MSSVSSLTGTSLSSFINPANTTAPLTVGGLVSGLDTNSIIQGLLATDQQKITNITNQETAVQAEQTAFKSVEAKLLALQTTITPLARSQNSVFAARAVQVSDDTALSAAASGNALAGDYHLRINSLALAGQTASQGFDSLTSSISHGTLALQIGTTTTNLTVDSSNDTLQGLASAINASGAAVSASIVNDGSGDGQQGYRLLLSAKATGVANRVVITNNLADSGGGATKPIFDTGSISNAIATASDTSTASVQANAGGGYTGASNNVYTFTVVQGGTVGTDDGLQIAYSDTSGTHTGTINLDHGDVNSLKLAAQGVGIQLGAGTLVAGDTFTVKAFVPTVQAAADASVTVGSGAGALTVTNASNKIDGLIPGVTLSLQNADPTKDVEVTVANDTNGMATAIESFVSAYNDLISYIDQQTAYDSNTSTAAPLLGNIQVLKIEDQVRSLTHSLVPGASPSLNYLGALGITTNDDGELSLDTTKLTNILAGNQAGVTADDVRKLFTFTGSSPNSGIQFVNGTASTRSSSTPYTVNITQAASQASVTAGNALAASTVIDGSNNTFALSLDGITSSTLSLAAGTYTRTALAQALQTAINGDSSLTGHQVSVAVAGNNLSIASSLFGAASRVGIVSGTALSPLGFNGSESAQGNDVAGTFLVNNVAEPATGIGQFFSGVSSNTNTAGLQVRVTLTPAQVGAGTQADLTVSRGVASQLDSAFSSLLDPVNGRLKTIDDNYASQIQDLEANKTTATNAMSAKQAQLQEQFNNMEQTLAQLQSAGNIIAQQQAALNKSK